MPKSGSRLGRGLEALFDEYVDADQPTAPRSEGEAGAEGSAGVAIPCNALRPNPFQPRREFAPDALEELAASIRDNGLVQPIVVRRSSGRRADGAGGRAEGDGAAYEIVAGERRFRAVRSLGWSEVPVIVRTLSDEEMLVHALVENLQREDLGALEEARGYESLMASFGLKQREVADRVGRDRSTVANALRLLRLPAEIQRLIAAGRLSAGHGRALLTLSGAMAQVRLGRLAVEHGWSVRETERRARAAEAGTGREGGGRKKAEGERDPFVRRAERELARGLGTQVRIRTQARGSGEVVVRFHDADDFLRLLALMGAEDLLSDADR